MSSPISPGRAQADFCNVAQRLLQAAMSAVTALSCMQGELSKQEAAALEALKESRARKLAALLSENKLQALQQKKAVEEAAAQASGYAAPQGALRRPEQQSVAQASSPGSGMAPGCTPETQASRPCGESQERAFGGTGTGTWAGCVSGCFCDHNVLAGSGSWAWSP